MTSPLGILDAVVTADLELDSWQVAILVGLGFCGVVAGLINSVAAGGSFLTLPALIAVGVPPSMANGTNRIGILVQSIAATASFRANDIREERAAARVFLPLAIGSVLGALAATRLSDALMRPVLGVLLLVWGVYLWRNPSSLRDPPVDRSRPAWQGHAIAFGIGIYGGFVQAGVGFALLALLVTVLGHEVVRANAIKVLCVLGLTLLALPIFVYYGQVMWIEGSALAVGTIIGGWLGARWQIKSGGETIHKVVLGAVALSGVALLVDSVHRLTAAR